MRLRENYTQMVRFLAVEPTYRVQVVDLALAVAFSGDVRSVGGDVPVDYEGVCGKFVNLKMMCRLSLSKVLIGIGGVCVCS
jgi:hypothetical protein